MTSIRHLNCVKKASDDEIVQVYGDIYPAKGAKGSETTVNWSDDAPVGDRPVNDRPKFTQTSPQTLL